MLFALLVAVATGSPARPAPAASPQRSASGPTHCLDSFLAVGTPLARPLDIALGKVSNPKPDYVIRTDFLIAPKLEKSPIVGYLYITHESNAFFSTRERKNVDPAVQPLIRDIYAASTTATKPELDALLARQDGNAVVFLPRALRLLRSLDLRAAPCVVLAKNAKVP